MINIEAIGVTKFFSGLGGKTSEALKDFSVEIDEGEIFVFLGPSGCGKSTLLRIFSGLDRASRGEIRYQSGFDQQDVAFVFQQFALLPWLTVSENIELGLIGRGVAEDERKKIVREELEIFGLAKFSHSYPRDLSGGMKQRVGLARAFAVKPKVIFMDEPFSELDSFTAADLRRKLLQIWSERKPTIVMVTHNIVEAVELADTIAVMTPGPGKIEAVVKNDLKRPRKNRTEEFFALEDKLYGLVKP